MITVTSFPAAASTSAEMPPNGATAVMSDVQSAMLWPKKTLTIPWTRSSGDRVASPISSHDSDFRAVVRDDRGDDVARRFERRRGIATERFCVDRSGRPRRVVCGARMVSCPRAISFARVTSRRRVHRIDCGVGAARMQRVWDRQAGGVDLRRRHGSVADLPSSDSTIHDLLRADAVSRQARYGCRADGEAKRPLSRSCREPRGPPSGPGQVNRTELVRSTRKPETFRRNEHLASPHRSAH